MNRNGCVDMNAIANQIPRPWLRFLPWNRDEAWSRYTKRRFNFAGLAPRKTLLTALDISGAGDDYRIIGRRTSDSSIDFGTQVTTETDVLGITDTDIGGMRESQAFAFPITDDYRVPGWLLDIYRRHAFDEFQGICALQIHAFEEIEEMPGMFRALEYDNCSIEAVDLGGAGEEGRTNLSFILHFGGEVRQGFADSAVFGEKINFVV
jgi:hypothetical protein